MTKRAGLRKEFKVTRLVAAMPPVETYTPERIAEFERESQVDAETEVAVREALAGPAGV